MTTELSDTLLRRALLEAAALDFSGATEEFPLSPRQARRHKALLADPFGYARRAARPLWKKTLHSAAMAAVAAGLSLAMLSAASPTVRAAIKQWFMEIRQWDIVYYFTGNPIEKELPYYTFTDLPEGYVYTEEKYEDGYRRIRYENEDGQRIRLEYMDMEDGSAFWVDTEQMEVRDVWVNACPGQVFLSSDPKQGNAILWIDEGTNIQFFIDAFVEESVLLHMAESISLCKTEKP